MTEKQDYTYRILKIYINEKEHYEGMPLHEWILHEAQKKEMLSVTVLRGVEGTDFKNRLHTIKLLNLSIDLPLIIEIFDKRDKICNFSDNILDNVIKEGIVTIERIKAKVYNRK
ncbi:MAG: DUF190 domain-containing protein [Victivallales bacterium]|nr:DUF190 domain-containing protein [Victivallales bacterium]